MAATTEEPTTLDAEAMAALEARLASEGGEETPVDPASTVNDVDDIEMNVEHREWLVTGEYTVQNGTSVEARVFEGKYVQKPLGYFAMMEFTGLLGRKIDEAMSGPEGLSIDRLMPSEGFQLPLGFEDGRLTVANNQSQGVDGFLRAIAKLMAYVPDILLEAQCVWLRVPRRERFLVMDIWGRDEESGGLSMDDGLAMMTLFIDQNYQELERFFLEEVPKVFGRALEGRKKIQKQKRAHKGA